MLTRVPLAGISSMMLIPQVIISSTPSPGIMLPRLSTKSHFLPLIILSLPRRQAFAMSATAGGDANPPPPSHKTVRVVVKGRVQGVFYRDWTVQNARELALTGWVRNRRDGTVEALFSGDPSAVDEMVHNRCRLGPPSAVVTALNSFPATDDDIPGQGFQRRPTA